MTAKREEFKINGDELVAKVKELIKAGNVRKIIIRNEKDEDIIEIPLTFAVVGAVIVPVIAAVGAAAALLTKCTIVVERNEK